MYRTRSLMKSLVAITLAACAFAFSGSALASSSIASLMKLGTVGVPATAKLIGEPSHYFLIEAPETSELLEVDSQEKFLTTLRDLDATHERSYNLTNI